MIIGFMIVFIFWLLPCVLRLRQIYIELPEDSSIRDLLDYDYGEGWIALIPFVNWAPLIANIITNANINFLDKKIK
jgi:hypothetical protein